MGGQKHRVILFLRSKHVLITRTLLFIGYVLHKILLYHIKVIFTTIKTNYRDLIKLLLPLFLHPIRKHLEIWGIWVLFQ